MGVPSLGFHRHPPPKAPWRFCVDELGVRGGGPWARGRRSGLAELASAQRRTSPAFPTVMEAAVGFYL